MPKEGGGMSQRLWILVFFLTVVLLGVPRAAYACPS
jgi:hypothetical protein